MSNLTLHLFVMIFQSLTCEFGNRIVWKVSYLKKKKTPFCGWGVFEPEAKSELNCLNNWGRMKSPKFAKNTKTVCKKKPFSSFAFLVTSVYFAVIRFNIFEPIICR